jgi:hypothetical protein
MTKGNEKKNSETKKAYLPDTVFRTLTIPGNIRIQLLANSYGYFMDFRQFAGKFPTKKGLRIHLARFRQIVDCFSPDVDKILEHTGQLEKFV